MGTLFENIARFVNQAIPVKTLGMKPVHSLARPNHAAAAEINRSYSCSLAEFPSRARLVERTRTPSSFQRAHQQISAQWPLSAGFHDQSQPQECESVECSTGTLDSAELERQLWHLFEGADDAPPAKAVHSKSCARFGKISVDKLEDGTVKSGYITEIGKFLLDPDAVQMFERIIQNGQKSKHVCTLNGEHAAALLRLQSYLMKQQHVLSTIVIGMDGKIMSSSCARTNDLESIAAWAICAYINSKIAAQMLCNTEQPGINHIVLTGAEGTTFVSQFGTALLLTITSAREADAVGALVQKLDSLLA